MKPKQRRRLEARHAYKAELLLEEIPKVCGHCSIFMCSRCKSCYACEHELVQKEEADTIVWWVCSDGFTKPSYPDRGQFARLSSYPTSKGIQWQKYI